MAVGALLGLATYIVGRERRYITTINIALCFPELGAKEQKQLVRRCFIDNGIGLVETGTGWVRPPQHFMDMTTFTGTEYVDAALATGRGVLLLGAHYSTLDFGANLLSMRYPFGTTFRAHKNPLFDAFMLRGRQHYSKSVFDRRDIRGVYKHLRQNKILWYAPDQDYGPEHALYAPFFGQPAATITTASRFANFNQSPIVLVRQHRDTHNKRYTLEFTALSPLLPSGDDLRDITVINAAVEHAIRQEPSQYLWMHKRFKTQPGGKPDSPYIHIKTPDKKLSEILYAGMLEGAQPHSYSGLLQLTSGLVLREFPGLPHKLFKHNHPALQLDHLSKQLRSCGIRTLTTDNIFRVRARNLTAATCFLPEGAALHPDTVDMAEAAAFLAQLHNSGFHFLKLDARALIVTTRGLVLADPLLVRQVPGSASYRQRLNDLRTWLFIVARKNTSMSALLEHYQPHIRRTDAEGFRLWLAHQPALADNGSASATSNGIP